MSATERTWEVRDNVDHVRAGEPIIMRVERGTGDDLEVAAEGITDYGLACVIEAACNLRDGTVE